MKAIKKLIALTLAASLTLGTSLTVFADYDGGDYAPATAESQGAEAPEPEVTEPEAPAPEAPAPEAPEPEVTAPEAEAPQDPEVQDPVAPAAFAVTAAFNLEPEATNIGINPSNAIDWGADPTGTGAVNELLTGIYNDTSAANEADVSLTGNSAGTLIVPADFEVTITGIQTGGAALTVQIPDDSTVIWAAQYDVAGTTTHAVSVTGGGTFQVMGTARIEHTGTTGTALVNNTAATLNIDGSVLAASTAASTITAITIGANTELNIHAGATVRGSRAIYSAAALVPSNVTIGDFFAIDGEIRFDSDDHFMVGFGGGYDGTNLHDVFLTETDATLYAGNIPSDPTRTGWDFLGWFTYPDQDEFAADTVYDEHTLFYAMWEDDGTGGGQEPTPLPDGVESVSLSRATLPHTGGNVVVTIGFDDDYFDPNVENIFVFAGGDGLFAAMVYPFNNPEGTADVYGRAVVTFLHQNTTEYPINYQLYMFVARPTTTSPNAGTNYRLGDYGVRLLPAPETMPFVGPSFQRNVDPAGAAQFAQLRPGTSPLPGTPAHSFTSGVASSTRVMQGIVANPPAVVTADGLIGDIRAVLPAGVTAEWSANTPFTVRDGQATGLIIITIGNFRTAIVVDLPTADAE